MARQLRRTHQGALEAMSRPARLFLVVVWLLGFMVAIYGAWTCRIDNLPKFLAYLLTAIVASRLKLGLPEASGSMSVNFLFIVIGIAELNFSETLILGCSAILAQPCISGRRWPRLHQVLFNVSSAAIAIWLAYFTYHGPLRALLPQNLSLLLVLSACVYFVANTLPVATIISLTENKSVRKIWADCYFWSFPYYLARAAVAGMVGCINHKAGRHPA